MNGLQSTNEGRSMHLIYLYACPKFDIVDIFPQLYEVHAPIFWAAVCKVGGWQGCNKGNGCTLKYGGGRKAQNS